MNQTTREIRLRDLMDSQDGWGHEEGHAAHERLRRIVEKSPEISLWAISLHEVRRNDASFPRESVVALAKLFRRQKGFCIRDLESVNLFENWDAAALKLEQPLLTWSSRGGMIVGPPPSEGLRPTFEALMRADSLTTSELATELGLQTTNASNKLKALWEAGYIMRQERTASTGGIEFEYFVVR